MIEWKLMREEKIHFPEKSSYLFILLTLLFADQVFSIYLMLFRDSSVTVVPFG